MRNTIKNRYIKKSHISEKKFREILRAFCSDITSQNTSQLTGVSHNNSINKMYEKFRNRIIDLTENDLSFQGEVELNESYFGAKRVRGKRGQGTAGKKPVLGILKRDGFYVEVVHKYSKEELLSIIQGKSTIYTDGWKAYDGLIFNGYDHYRIFHQEMNLCDVKIM